MWPIALQLRIDGQPQAAEIRPLALRDADALEALQADVVRQLDDAEHYYPLSRSEIEDLLDGSGFTLGVWAGGELLAFRTLYFPRERDDNLGRELGLTAAEQLKVAHLEASVVHPAARGNGLQLRLTQLALAGLGRLPELQGARAIRYLCATVALGNVPSLKEKFAAGLHIAALKRKYGGSWRYLFFRDLAAKAEADGANEHAAAERLSAGSAGAAAYVGNGGDAAEGQAADGGAAEAAPRVDSGRAAAAAGSAPAVLALSDVSGQQALLAAGWRGVALAALPGGGAVRYAPPRQ